ncbi:hypothetical protein J5Y04_21525 [Kitasatospora sp. RG8]|uniref:hypothetical protein n=1 Tax=Kitasatospora sp. RG8 TaxID=2820815 RepID=UPI001AE0507C|nr:hypothetical protein [Kitasatospora sp. RG8]MBP0452099.1 hypothetical protein [Kitasatospora sp. RG8]
MSTLSARNALIFGLCLSVPISAAILIAGGRADGPSPTSVAASASPTPMAPTFPTATATVTVTATATVKVTEQAAHAPVSTASAAPTRNPQGTVDISNWQNDIEYNDSCAKLDVTVSNRSDTAVDEITLYSKGEDGGGAEIALPPMTFSAGIAPFADRRFSLKICDKRMADKKYGPAAIPTRITWTWMGS